MSILEQTKVKMQAAIDHLFEELKSIRTGRANPAMLDNIMVEVYGSQMRIKDVASVNAVDSRQLLIAPFDMTTKGLISKAIEKANLGFMPIVDGNAIRIKIPPMDESLRKEMIKICSKRGEDGKVNIRNIRREANELVRKLKTEGKLAEDEKNKMEKQIQELTDKSCKEMDEITARKEKEVSVI